MAPIHIRIETSVRGKKKWLQAGPAACWLWACALMYAQDTRSDGLVPEEALPLLGVPDALPLVDVLLNARLFDKVDGGWRVHDYLKHNKSAAEIEAVSTTKKEIGKLGGRPAKSKTKRTAKAASLESENQTGLEDQKQTENQPVVVDVAVVATVPEVPQVQRSTPIHSQREHRNHYVCGRVCLPAFLHAEFERRRGNVADLEAFYSAVLREWAPGGPRGNEEPGEALAFWRARYAERWPSTPTKAASVPISQRWRPGAAS